MQLPTHIAQALNQRLLDVHVDVFELAAELESTGFDVLADLRQSVADLLAFLPANQADGCQHLGMRDRAGNIMGV